ncbi:MAG: hypothetical protein HFH48_09925 [Lachnospiraceae bacterium]|nr:hypothetical protein [Lachnospiraceae bacterium]
MQPYQEEYLVNLKDISALSLHKKTKTCSLEEYMAELSKENQQIEQKIKRNMELLRNGLFPVLEHIHEADPETLQGLQEFAGELLHGRGRKELDVGLFCQIHKALLTLARLSGDRNSMIRELYWLGMGYNNLNNKLVGLHRSQIETYISQMRLSFTEAAAYLKYYDEIDDTETRGYILRSRANMSLGQFKSASAKIHMVKRTLEILQDEGYQEKEPDIPWERYIYMTHQQMAASISHSKESAMTPEDVADIMESVYIIHEKHSQEAAARQEALPIRPQFSYCAIEYYCGLDTLDGLLTKLERLMDKADLSDYSVDSMYGIISLPAFYCQYLTEYPERIPERTKYIEGLYQRVLDYVDFFPDAAKNEALFFYLRQLSFTFLETKKSISYKTFLLKLQMRFVPDLYAHSWIVGKAASVFCEIILKEEPEFFDDIDMIREITDFNEKHEKILNYAMECGLFHDVGKMNFINLYSQTGRQWFEEEYEMAHLHTLLGESCLSARISTQHYAPIAHGHHSWYDGSHGYPESYQRLKSQYRQMTDLIGLLDWIHNTTSTQRLRMGLEKTFDEAVQAAIDLEGKRFSPLLTSRLRDKQIAKRIELAFTEGYREAYRHIYEEF